MKVLINLHTHTEHSNYINLDCMNKVEDVISYAKTCGHKGIAITDHETVGSNHFEAIRAAKNIEDFKLILGNEIYLCKRKAIEEKQYVFPHFILLAKNARGHRALRELSTRAWCENSLYWVSLRRPTYYEDLFEVLEEYKGDLIGSTACIGGTLGKLILREDVDDVMIQYWLAKMDDAFGHGNFFLEMQPHEKGNIEQEMVNRQIVEFSEMLDIPYIITTDAHYLRKEDRPVHEAFLKSQEADRETGDFYATTYIMSEEEIREYLWYLGKDVLDKAFANSDIIGGMVEEYELEKPLNIPYIPDDISEPNMDIVEEYTKNIPLLKDFATSKWDADRHLVREIIKGMKKEPEVFETQKAYDEIEFELNSIKLLSDKQNTPWSAYLLQTRQLIDICWEAGSLVGPLRGSAGGFVILYLLGVIQICSLKEDVQLYPWRFLNPSRVSPLDIDVDVMGDQRENIIEALKEKYGGYRHITKVQTLLKAKSKASLQIACRGLGLTKEEGIFLGGFIKSERGTPYTLDETYETDKQFRDLMDNQYLNVWEVAKRIEGLITGVGQHAGGVILCKEDLVDNVALMKMKSGDIITQTDLHISEAASLIKWDLLGVDCLQKIYTCMELLMKDGLIKWQGSLKETYDKYLGPYKIDKISDEIWDKICAHQILSLFQFEGQAGIQAIELGKPRNLESMSALNSIMRLMPQDGGETPLEKYKRFRDDIKEWYGEMKEWGLTEEEMKWTEKYALKNFGFLPNQENFMSILQDEKVGGFDLLFCDRVRKSIAKKNTKGFLECEEEYYKVMKENNLSEKLCKYVWEVLIGASKGYGFNTSHTLGYSTVALQEANLAVKYPMIYWNCANLISDSGGKGNPKYDKIGNAVNRLKREGVEIVSPLINLCEYEFSPKNNKIIFGLKPIIGVPSAVAESIIEEREKNGKFLSFEDFCERVKPTNSATIALIKAGCFEEFGGKKEIMERYIKSTVKEKAKLTVKDMDFMVKNKLIDGKDERVRVARFKDYICKPEFFIENTGKSAATNWYLVPYDDRFKSANFFETYYMSNMLEDKEYKSDKRGWLVKRGAMDKVVKSICEEILIDEESVRKFNEFRWEEKMPEGTEPQWEIQTLLTYIHKHELENIDKEQYMISNFFELPEEPFAAKENYKKWNGRIIPRYEISRLAGTVIATDKNKNLVTLLTCDGAVTCKLYSGQFRSYMNETDGQENWLAKGTKLFVHGYRSGDQFIAKSYSDSAFGRHVLNKVDLLEDGRLIREVEKNGESR